MLANQDEFYCSGQFSIRGIYKRYDFIFYLHFAACIMTINRISENVNQQNINWIIVSSGQDTLNYTYVAKI
ncbi:hypothetical protein C8R14_1152 [Nitrosomonas eutropha]|uniref:Uncharacterized protein n=1 Tax=Nitrosomonas eutropha TaxID=916 RepID=A0ABX5M6F5_9PROT|nr:hypothetical protein C8R14_1152 [Nitrosomonas eutropha]SEJ13311.1 hypothetical protein SAMN05216318_12633 [Nitrosomonas eutropha]